jgi:hypothetical protein
MTRRMFSSGGLFCLKSGKWRGIDFLTVDQSIFNWPLLLEMRHLLP